MPVDRIAFALWRASVCESDLLVIRSTDNTVELQLRGGNARLRIVLARKAA